MKNSKPICGKCGNECETYIFNEDLDLDVGNCCLTNVINESNDYISIQQNEVGLHLFLTAAQKRAIKENFDIELTDEGIVYPDNIGFDSNLFCEITESIRANSPFMFMQGKDLGLTETFGLGWDVTLNDEGDIETNEDSQIFYYKDYMVQDLFVELFVDGFATLHKA